MKKALFINSVCGIGSTGKICLGLAKALEEQGYECKIAYGRGDVPAEANKYAVRIGTNLDNYLHVLKTRVFDEHGFGSVQATKHFLQWAEEYKPDLLWLHNIHGYYINIELLFAWIKKHPEMQVKWTLHDCWAFTGHCSYFTMANCSQWKNHCVHCVQKSAYPSSYLRDNSYDNFDRKKNAFTGIKNLTLITPSKWLGNLVGESFLKEYPVEVHYNTIDKEIFKPTPSNFRIRYHLENNIIILGVANVWSKRKGLNDILSLANKLDDRYVIVIVGLNHKQIKRLPPDIIRISRILDQKELASIYSAADLYVNPRHEETFGMTTADAEYSGTHSIVYEGSASEEVARKLRGVVIQPDPDILANTITSIFTVTNNRGGRRAIASRVILIPKTNNQRELAMIYSAANIFVNPTYEDNYPTVNLEAEACGTPVISYNTGGAAETLHLPQSII